MGTDRKPMAIHRQMIAKEQADLQVRIQRNDEDALLHRVAAIVVIEPKHLNGDAVQMVLELFAMLVDCVSFPYCFHAFSGLANGYVDYAKLTRKVGANKAQIGSSNLRPKGPGSPTA